MVKGWWIETLQRGFSPWLYHLSEAWISLLTILASGITNAEDNLGPSSSERLWFSCTLSITSRPWSHALSGNKDIMVKQNQELWQNPGQSRSPNSYYRRSSNIQHWEIKMNIIYTINANLFVVLFLQTQSNILSRKQGSREEYGDKKSFNSKCTPI